MHDARNLHKSFRAWLSDTRERVAAASGRPEQCFLWFRQVEREGVTKADLYDSGDFGSLDSKLSAALGEIITGPLANDIAVERERMAKEDFYLKGRQVLLMMIEWYRVCDSAGAIYEFSHLQATKRTGNNLSKFMYDWNRLCWG